MLIEQLMPVYNFSERHTTKVDAAPERIYAALTMTDLSSSPFVKVLLAARALPAQLFSRTEHETLRTPKTLRDAERFGFFVVGDNPPHELVIALQGKFWTLSGEMECASRSALDLPLTPGSARAVWNFSVHPCADGSCTLATETRILCADPTARRKFRIYWMIVRPGSGLIRRAMLNTIRKAAEA